MFKNLFLTNIRFTVIRIYNGCILAIKMYRNTKKYGLGQFVGRFLLVTALQAYFQVTPSYYSIIVSLGVYRESKLYNRINCIEIVVLCVFCLCFSQCSIMCTVGLTRSQFLEGGGGGYWEEGGNLFHRGRGCSFCIKFKRKSEIFNDKKSSREFSYLQKMEWAQG